MTTILDFRADLTNLLATTPDPSTWPDALLDEAIRQTLDDLNHQLIYETTFTVLETGHEQDLSSVTAIDEILAVAMPWHDGADWSTFTTRWHLIEPTTVYFTDIEPSAGTYIRIRYTQRHTIEDLDTADATTVPANLRRLFARGAASHACLLRIRQLTENPAAPKDAIPHLQSLAATWRTTFESGLTRANSRRHITWPQLGL